MLLLCGQSTEDSRMHHHLKRIVDLVVSTTLLVILSPFLLLIAIAIRLESEGNPVSFRPVREG